MTDTVDTVGEQAGNEISIVQRGDRLKITADVDPEGIKTLHEMLADHLRRAEEQKPKRKHRRVAEPMTPFVLAREGKQ